jgi:MFS family permease
MYIVIFVIFFGACVGLAETKAYSQLLVLRCLQSTGSASTIAIGSGVIGDITKREERSGYMGIFQAGLLVPTAAGPVRLSRSVITFYVCFCARFLEGSLPTPWDGGPSFGSWQYSGVFLAILILFLPETLRSLVGNGSIPARGLSQNPISHIRARLQKGNKFSPAVKSSKTLQKELNFLGPVRLIFGLEVSCAIFYLSIYYTGWQMTTSAMSTLFSRTYGLTSLSNGLTFMGNGAGFIIGTLSTGKILDYSYRRLKKTYNGPPEDFPLERRGFRRCGSGADCSVPVS